MKTTELLQHLKPYVLGWISTTGGGSGPYAPTPHDLDSAHHTGSLSDSQAPQFLMTDGTRQLVGNLSVGAGVTIDGVDLSVLDGDFATFKDKILALPVTFTDDGVRWITLRGDELTFSWTGPLVKNGEASALQNQHHIENVYCTTEFPAPMMDIRYGGVGMRLAFDETEPQDG